MTACRIVPFPSVRRVGYVRNLANMMAITDRRPQSGRLLLNRTRSAARRA
jgi:hypothetical protein